MDSQDWQGSQASSELVRGSTINITPVLRDQLGQEEYQDLPARLAEIDERCSIHDTTTFRQSLDFSLNWSSDVPPIFLATRQKGTGSGREREVIGYLALFMPSRQEVEISAAVVPEERCRRVFSRLLSHALSYLRPLRGAAARDLLFVNDSRSVPGRAMLDRWGLPVAMTEHMMVLNPDRFSRSLPLRYRLLSSRISGRVYTAPWAQGSRDTFIALNQAIFDEPLEDAASMVDTMLKTGESSAGNTKGDRKRPRKLNLAIHLRGLTEPIGMAGMTPESEMGLLYIYGFGILPQYRGRGYGKEALIRIIRSVRRRYPHYGIALEVNSQNAHALALYTSLGFEDHQVIEYRRIPLVRFDTEQGRRLSIDQ